MWYTAENWTTGDHNVGKITPSGTITEYAISGYPGDLIAGSEGNLWLAEYGSSAIDAITTSGSITRYPLPSGSDPVGITKGPEGNFWFTDSGTSKVGKITTSGAITEYSLPSKSEPTEISGGPDGNLWFCDFETSKIGKITPEGAITEYSLPAKSGPYGITAGPDGNVWFTDVTSSKIGKITSSGTISEYAQPTNSDPVEIAEGPDGDLWYADKGTSKIAKTPTSGSGSPTEGTHYTPGPGATVEYNVPVSGAGAPYALGTKEAEAWAQTDDPESGTAIIAPDEPQGWPAGSYKRASIFYLDSENHTVNVASPTGGIATAEYNGTTGNLTRTLTPDNREAALKETGKTAAAAQDLSTKLKYSADGTLLEEALGPEHTIKREGGSTVSARAITIYEYDKNEPAGGPYRLVTSTTSGLLSGGNIENPRTVTESYNGQENLGWKLHEPTSSSTTAGGVTLTSGTTYEPATGQIEESQTPAASGKDWHVPPAYNNAFGVKGASGGDFSTPAFDAIDASKNVWVVDTGNNRLEEFSSSGTFTEAIGWGVSNGEAKLETCTSSCKAGIAGSGNGQFSEPIGIAIAGGDVYVSDYNNDRVEVLNEKAEYVSQFGTKGTGAGQFEGPVAVSVGENGDVWVGDLADSRLEEFSATGTFIRTIGWGVSNGEAKFEICSSSCKAGTSGSGNGQFDFPQGIAFTGGKMYVADYGDNRIEEFNEAGEYVSKYGTSGSGNGQFKFPVAIARNPLNGDLYVVDWGNDRIEEITGNLSAENGAYVYQFADKGSGHNQLSEPEGIAVNSNGHVYVVDTGNNRIEQWTPTVSGKEGAHTTQTIYYTAGTNPHVESCGNHPEWAGLPCQAQPAKQPESGLPGLLTTTYTYNMWDEPVATTDTSGSTKRTTTITYDSAGRPDATSITGTADTTPPIITSEYNEKTGALEKQCANEGKACTEGKPKTITSVLNTLGEMTSYTDAAENTTTYEYETGKDYRLVKVNDGKGTQTLGYSTTTGLVESLEDSAAGTFTATRDAEGNITSETYPNGMTATITRNPAGEATGLEYTKGKDTIYTDSVVPSIHGQWLSQMSSLSSENYAYNEVGWLHEVQETPTGKGCTTRLYSYDEDGNRTSETTREPGSEGKCATEGGTIQTWSYDTADRLDETGVSYDPFGNITALPAENAGGTTLHSTFYLNNLLATLEQGEQKITYELDPAERPLETISTGPTKSTVIAHYRSPEDTPSWTESSGTWTRYIDGIGGGLAAIQTGGGTTALQIATLHGDIIGTVPDASETEPKLANVSEANEFGVPRTSKPEPYTWLGADERRTELPSGVINMGARAYIPQLGRYEQADPQPGASVTAYAYTQDNPVSEADPSGESGGTITYDENAVGEGEGTNLPGGVGTAPGAIMPPPVNAQIEEEFNANPPWDAPSAFEAGNSVSWFAGDASWSGTARLPFLTAPDDNSPDVESECNKTGQKCSGCRSGGARNKKHECQPGKSSNEGLKNACAVAGVFISLASWPESVPVNVAKAISAGGAGAAAACRLL